MRCEICFGYFPPFSEVDEMIYRKWEDEKTAAEEQRLRQWRTGQ
jgi:hypothetical protein